LPVGPASRSLFLQSCSVNIALARALQLLQIHRPGVYLFALSSPSIITSKAHYSALYNEVLYLAVMAEARRKNFNHGVGFESGYRQKLGLEQKS